VQVAARGAIRRGRVVRARRTFRASSEYPALIAREAKHRDFARRIERSEGGCRALLPAALQSDEAEPEAKEAGPELAHGR
jgi:hypothetical protein